MIKLQIGSFDTPIEGWYNTDITPHIFVSRVPFLPAVLHSIGLLSDERYRQHRSGIFKKIHYLNAARPFPFQDNSVDAIYSSHMLVNLQRSRSVLCLRECFRVLKPGKILRIAVPDLDRWVKEYDPRQPDAFVQLFFLSGVKGEKNFIKWMYNAFSLSAMMTEAGFVNVQRYSFGKGNIVDIEKLDYRSDSLFLEGSKP